MNSLKVITLILTTGVVGLYTPTACPMERSPLRPLNATLPTIPELDEEEDDKLRRLAEHCARLGLDSSGDHSIAADSHALQAPVASTASTMDAASMQRPHPSPLHSNSAKAKRKRALLMDPTHRKERELHVESTLSWACFMLLAKYHSDYLSEEFTTPEKVENKAVDLFNELLGEHSACYHALFFLYKKEFDDLVTWLDDHLSSIEGDLGTAIEEQLREIFKHRMPTDRLIQKQILLCALVLALV